MMKDEHKEQLKKFDEMEQEVDRAKEAIRDQRREYINLHDLNKEVLNESYN